jgi:GST-like protein
MIDVYSWATPNGHKVHIALEELGLKYEAHGVNIGTGEQFDPAFLKISPNNRIPAIVDHDGPGGKPLSLFESGAILLYLAEKTGKLLSKEPHARYTTLQWLFWQMGGLGPMLGQTHHFRAYATEKIPYAIDRYTNEANRLYRVLDKRLGEARYLGGDEYSIADIACWPWMRYPDRQAIDLEPLKNYKRWFEEIGERPAVKRGTEVLTAQRSDAPMDEKQREILFGKTQFQTR